MCISNDVDIRSSLLALEKCGLGIILVTKKNKLIGTLTDGDIRRALLNEKQLNSNVEGIINKNFYFIYEKDDLIEAEENLLKRGLRHLPVLDKAGTLIKLLVSSNLSKRKNLSNSVRKMTNFIDKTAKFSKHYRKMQKFSTKFCNFLNLERCKGMII